MATPATVDEVPEEDFDAVNAEAEEDTAEESPNVSEYSTEDDEEVSVPLRLRITPAMLALRMLALPIGGSFHSANSRSTG